MKLQITLHQLQPKVRYITFLIVYSSWVTCRSSW